MKRVRLATVISLLCLLSLATSAAAAGAWVLWVKYTSVNVTGGKPVDEGGWLLRSAVPTYAACIEAARESARQQSEPTRGATNVAATEMSELIGGGFTVLTEYKKPKDSAFIVEFRCFPDTVDPRSKGK